MQYYDFEDEYEAASQAGGVFPGLWMPPLIVIIIGLLIGFVTSGAVITQSVTAASNLEEPAQLGAGINNDTGEEQNIGNGGLANLFSPEILHWKQLILNWSGTTGLDPNLIATVMQIESCGDPNALSSAGAMGLFQVMPFHFKSSDDPFDPETNALRGMSYLSQSLISAEGDARLAFAGYNGGISVIHKAEESWVAETQRYAYWGIGIYEEASQGIEVSSRLQEWLSHGGASLCKQAAVSLGLNH